MNSNTRAKSIFIKVLCLAMACCAFTALREIVCHMAARAEKSRDEASYVASAVASMAAEIPVEYRSEWTELAVMSPEVFIVGDSVSPSAGGDDVAEPAPKPGDSIVLSILF